MKTVLRNSFAVLLFAFSLVTFADNTKLDIQPGETIRTLLERHVSRTVTIKLRSGEEVGGTVTRLGNGVVHLAKVAGRDYYDAVISLDAIAAVFVRTRGP
jgi:hypothetical protein